MASITGPNDHKSSARSGNPKSARRPCSCARGRTCSNSRRISARALLGTAAAGRRAQQDVLEQAVAGLDLEDPLEQADEREPAVGLGRGRLGERHELAEPPLEDGLHERVARREVPVERADADARAPGDLLERRLDAAFGEDLAGRGDEQLVIAPRVAALPRLLACDPRHDETV